MQYTVLFLPLIFLLLPLVPHEPSPAPGAAVAVRRGEPAGPRVRADRPLPAVPGEGLPAAAGGAGATGGVLLPGQRQARRGAGGAAGSDGDAVHGALAGPAGGGVRGVSPGVEAGAGAGAVRRVVPCDHLVHVPRAAAGAREGEGGVRRGAGG